MVRVVDSLSVELSRFCLMIATFYRGQQMGLREWRHDIRTGAYPPSTISSAVAFSTSAEVKEMHARAERLGAEAMSRGDTGGLLILPAWAMTWPGGQLSGIGRNGAFASNIRRYEQVFRNQFGDSSTRRYPSTSSLHYVNVVSLENLKNDDLLFKTLAEIKTQINQRCPDAPAIGMNGIPHVGVHRNASNSISSMRSLSTSDEELLKKLFRADTSDLEAMCGMKFGWKTSIGS